MVTAIGILGITAVVVCAGFAILKLIKNCWFK